MRRWIILLVLLTSSFALSAQHANFNFYNVSTENGLPTNFINSVFQDSYGFLWIGSYEGVYRWDGYAFRHYKHVDHDPASLNHNIVYTIFEDSQKRLWIGTIEGLNLYQRATDNFMNCTIRQPGDKVPVNAIKEDSKKQLWLGTSFGLCLYTHESGQNEWFFDGNNTTIFSLTLDKDDNVWMGTFSGGVAKFITETRRFTRVTNASKKDKFSTNNIKSIYCDKDNRIWVGTNDHGLVVLNTNGTVHKQYSQASISASSANNTITYIYQDKSNRMWIGIGRESLHYIDEKTDALVPLKAEALNHSENQLAFVTGVFEDSFNNLWFSTSGHGLFYTNSFKNIFANYIHTRRELPGLNTTVITSFLEDRDGNVWIGTESGGVVKANLASKGFELMTTKNSNLSIDAITDIKQDKDGAIWMSTWNGGIMRMDPATRHITTLLQDPTDPRSLPVNDAKTILPDDTIVWIGTHGEGIAAFDKKSKTLIHHRNNTHFSFDMNAPGWINHLFKDSQKRLWISTYSGLFLFTGKEFTRYQHSSDSTSLSSNAVNMVCEDQNGRIWIATESGLDEFMVATKKFKRHRQRLGLPDVLKGLVVDDYNVLWISSNSGLFAYDIGKQHIRHYDVTDGLQGNSFFHKAVMKDKNGRLFFGGTRGFNVFHPKDFREFQLPSYFYVTDLYINNVVQRPGSNDSPINQTLANTDKLTLKSDQGLFSIEVAAVNLYSPNKVQYAYKLEGANDQWIPLQNERKITFTELPHGSYKLNVRYLDIDGRWKSLKEPLAIVILPPWYKTVWFRLSILLLFLALVAGVFWIRVRTIKIRNIVLKAEVQKRTHELSEANAFLVERNEMIKLQNERLEEYNSEILRQSEKILDQQKHITEQNHQLESTVDELQKLNKAKDHFFSILAHDLKNPIYALTGISDFMKSNFLKLEKKDAMNYLDSIHKSSTAIYELLTNLLNWSQTQSKNIEYRPVQINVNELFQKNITLLETQLKNKHITIAVDVSADLFIYADYNMLDTVIRNIISNSIKFTEYNGTIKLGAKEKQDKVELTLSDSGVGMTKEQLDRLFSLDKSNISAGTAGEKGTGLGLVITYEFMQINKGTIVVESEPKKGTTFHLTLPASKHAVRPLLTVSRSSDTPSTAIDFWDALPIDKLIKLKGKKVLIVDDNAELRSYLRLLLSGTFEIFEACNGEEGLATALDIQPTVIISDLIMPVMSGLEFCRLAKTNSSTSHIPVILLTSQWEEKSQVSGYGAGADIYLTKPVKKDLLIQVVLNIIQNQERLRAKIQESLLGAHEFNLQEPTLNKLDEEFLTKLVTFIEANISDTNLDARVLCEEMGISRTVLYAKIKTLTGQSVHELIKSVRLKRSLVLLHEGRLNISQIALEVGFNSHSYFDKCFVKQYGVGPKEYLAKRKVSKNA